MLRPTNFWLYVSSNSLDSSISLRALSFLVLLSNWLGILAALVPSLLEYGKTWILAYCIFLQKSRHSLKSLSVSPGNPTMTSVVILISGLMALIWLMIDSYLALSYLRFISFRIFSLPDWRGICRWSQRIGLFFKSSINLSFNSVISIEDSLILFKPGMVLILLIKSTKSKS